MPRAKASAAPAKKPRAPKNAHQLAPQLPVGEVLRDFTKKEWKLGKPIGSGGFGLIYLASPNSSSAVSSDADHVMKVEPHNNGPLFCELHFYQRAAKPSDISQWMASKKLKTLGMPRYVASGSHESHGAKSRFMVMERFGTDLQKLFERNDKKFLPQTVYALGIKIIHVLEYIHSQGYVHADIKASNLLCQHKGPDEVFLVDYGLAAKYVSSDNTHKEYKEDPRRCHDGTIEFTSRDAHKGVAPSRRGDLEITGYCLLQWLCASLPWEDNLENKEYVSLQKHKYMKDIPGLIKKCGLGSNSEALKSFLTYVAGMGYEAQPDYDRCRQILLRGLQSAGAKLTTKLDFSSPSSSDYTSPAAKSKRTKRESSPESSPLKKVACNGRVSKAKTRTTTPKSAKKPRATTPKSAKKPPTHTMSSPEIIYPKITAPPLTISPKKKSTPASAKVKSGQGPPKKVKRLVLVSSSATQTSPGLQGLRRSQKKRK